MGQIPSTLYGTPFTDYVSAKYDCIGSSGDSYYDKLVGGVECNPVELSKTVIIQYLLSRYNPVTGEGLDCIYNQRPFVGVDDPNYNAEDQLSDSNYLQLFTGFLNTLCNKQTTISKITIKTIPMGINPFTLASDGSVEYSTNGTTYSTDPLEITGGETIYLRAAGSDCLECGQSAYEIYLGTVPEGDTPLTEEEWLDSLQGPEGEQGPPGTNANINGLTWRGNWTASPTPAYAVNDAVQSGGSSYVLVSTSAGLPSTDPAVDTSGRWDELALAGATGPAGAPGADGTDGATGVNAIRAVTGNHIMLSSGATPGVTPGTDKGVLVTMSATAANTFTIPAGLGTTHYPLGANGTEKFFQTSVMQLGTGQTQIVAANGVTLLSANNMRYLRTQYSACTIIRVAENTYYMFGDLTNVTY
jgi:hypothetical protein